MNNKVLTVRLPEAQLTQLETLARFDGVALAEEIREGVELLLAARRDDPDFRERVRESFEEARRLLGELEGTEAVVEALDTPVGAERDEDAREHEIPTTVSYPQTVADA